MCANGSAGTLHPQRFRWPTAFCNCEVPQPGSLEPKKDPRAESYLCAFRANICLVVCLHGLHAILEDDDRQPDSDQAGRHRHPRREPAPPNSATPTPTGNLCRPAAAVRRGVWHLSHSLTGNRTTSPAETRPRSLCRCPPPLPFGASTTTFQASLASGFAQSSKFTSAETSAPDPLLSPNRATRPQQRHPCGSCRRTSLVRTASRSDSGNCGSNVHSVLDATSGGGKR